MIHVTCPNCGKRFNAPDIEWHATSLSAPVTCPHCKQEVDPNGWKGLFGVVRGWLKKKGKP